MNFRQPEHKPDPNKDQDCCTEIRPKHRGEVYETDTGNDEHKADEEA